MGIHEIIEDFRKYHEILEKSEKYWYFQIFHFLRFFIIPQKWKIFSTRARILKQIGYSKRSRWDLSEYMVIFKIRARLENISEYYFHFWVPKKISKNRKTEIFGFFQIFRKIHKVLKIVMYFHVFSLKMLKKITGFSEKIPGRAKFIKLGVYSDVVRRDLFE